MSAFVDTRRMEQVNGMAWGATGAQREDLPYSWLSDRYHHPHEVEVV